MGEETGALSGIRVLDLSRVLSGPYCTMILADQGAEVVKIERPMGGDDARHYGPPDAGTDSGFFVSINRNKKSVVLDLKHADGRALLLRLAAEADVLVENFRPGVMDRLGYSHEILLAANPRLIYCSISGFGQTGPYRDRPGYNMTVQALSGAMTLTGEDGTPPHPIGLPVGDIPAGIYAATAIAMALFQRERTGEGRRIDISLFDALVSMVEFPVIRYGLTGVNPSPMGTRHPSITPYGIFRTQDVPIVVAVGSDSLWRTFSRVLERPSWLEDPRFADNASRTVHVDALCAEIEKALAARPASFWIDRLLVEGIPVAPIQRVADLFHDPHARERGIVTQLEQPGHGPVTVVGSPIQWIPALSTRHHGAPALGEHTRTVLQDWLALPAEEVDGYIERGAIAEG